jgi:hypothetical protein
VITHNVNTMINLITVHQHQNQLEDKFNTMCDHTQCQYNDKFDH